MAILLIERGTLLRSSRLPPVAGAQKASSLDYGDASERLKRRQLQYSCHFSSSTLRRKRADRVALFGIGVAAVRAPLRRDRCVLSSRHFGNEWLRMPVTHEYDRLAAIYDRVYDRWPAAATQQCVGVLAELAAGRAALELGIGTGRIGLPLAHRDVPVTGIDNAPAMLEALRAKPGSDRLQLVCADFADMPVSGPFGLIYAVGAFGYLLTQAEQLRCVVNAARCLAPDGRLLIQSAVPGAEVFEGGGKVSQVLDVPDIDGDGAAVMLVCSQPDPLEQRIDQRVVVLGESGTRIFSERRRYVWPSELDLMAQIAGLRLEVRWSDWARTPYHARSRIQISVYAPAGDCRI